jgi:signal recognition particle subunit SRP54
LDADVNLLVVKDFIKSIRQKSVGQIVNQGEDHQQVMIRIIKDELETILGSQKADIKLNNKLTKIMLVGLQGSGKTTTVAKLANYFKNKFNKKPLVVALDIYRPAAIDQLETLAKETKVDFYQKGTQDPVITADESLEIARAQGNDIIIYDTAGRLQTDEKLMNELVAIRNKVSPDEIIMVVDAMSGQDVVNVATEFNNYLNLSGFIITKLDSDARAGAALSLIHLLNVPIKFTGVGEKIGSLDIFYPERMADRILGFGDIASLAEKASEVIDETKAKKSLARMLAGKMDLEDLMQQMQQLAKMGSAGGLMKMLPNMPKVSDQQVSDAEIRLRT